MYGEIIYFINLLLEKKGFDVVVNEFVSYFEVVDFLGLCDSIENGNYRFFL